MDIFGYVGRAWAWANPIPDPNYNQVVPILTKIGSHCSLATCQLVVLKGRLRLKLDYVTGDREQCKVLRQMQFVHVDDLASAHIFLMECTYSAQATGRYICSSADTTIHIPQQQISRISNAH